MRRAALALVLLAACKKEPPALENPNRADASATPLIPDAGPPNWKESFEPPEPVTEPLQLVAFGKSARSKILSLKLHGDTVWLSTNGTDAIASSGGPLEKTKDPLDKLPYTPGTHDLSVVGFYPNLFVLRTAKSGPAQPTVFVFRGNAWHPADALPFKRKPIAFLAYGDSAMAVTGVHDPTQNPDSYFSSKEPGTVLTKIDADGHNAEMPAPANKNFIAWNGAWDKTGISLIGAIAEETDLSYGPHWVPVGTHIFQLGVDGKSTTTKIQGKKAYHSIVPGTFLYRNKGMTTAEPERFYIGENERWLPNGATTFLVDDAGHVTTRTLTGNHHNYLSRSRFVGANLYTIQGFRMSERQADPVTLQLLRVGANGITERVEFGALPMKPGAEWALVCEPTEILADQNDELWLQAACGCKGEWWDGKCPNTTPAVFRRGGPPQDPIQF